MSGHAMCAVSLKKVIWLVQSNLTVNLAVAVSVIKTTQIIFPKLRIEVEMLKLALNLRYFKFFLLHCLLAWNNTVVSVKTFHHSF